MTRLAVIGHPVAHSLSPTLFAEIAKITDRTLAYERIDIAPADLDARVAVAAAERAFLGWNVTLPHKERMIELVDRVDASAAAVGAINVVRFASDGTTMGANTDVAGVRSVLAHHGIALAGHAAAIFGTGGAARATAEALSQAGAARVTFVSRDATRAETLAATFAARHASTRFAGTTRLADAAGYAFFANATPVGMQGYARGELLPEAAAPGAWAFDCVYRPERTAFLETAAARGLRTASGVEMLVGQALEAYALWFGEPALQPGDSRHASLAAAVRKAL